MSLTFDEAVTLLENSHRSELVDQAFGDKEVYFSTPSGDDLGEGYYGHAAISVTVHGTEFTNEQALQLLTLGKLVSRERNDSQGDDFDEEIDDDPHAELYD
jgi:hypothetical protein